MSKHNLNLEQVDHLGHLGYSLADIEEMSEAEVEEHLATPEDLHEEWTDERFNFEREAIMSKI